MATVNDKLRDEGVRRAIVIERLGERQVKRVLAKLRRIEAQIISEILAFDGDTITPGKLSRRTQVALLASLGTIVAAGEKEMWASFTTTLERLAGYESRQMGKVLNNTLPIKWRIAVPGPNQVVAAVKSRPFQGRLLREWYQDAAEGAFKRLRGDIRTGYATGRTTQQIIQDVKANSLMRTRRGTEAVVRTALNHTANTAREVLYERNEGLIKSVQISATLDFVTSSICRFYDGKVFPVGKGPRPAFHINCRTSTFPITKSWKELGINRKDAPAGTRSSLDGRVPEKTTYYEWLKRQSAGNQDKVLGKKKGLLFRKGELKITKFV